MAAPSGSPAMTFKYPYKTLEELRNNSPSRKHGLAVEQEERWKRSAMNLIIQTSIQLRMDNFSILEALELLHRYYAEYSMVTNDRFLISMACLYLAGKLYDTPKSSRDIITTALLCIAKDPSEVQRQTADREWMAAAREKVNTAERALLYQLGFRFSQISPMGALATMVGVEPLASFLKAIYPTEEERNKFVQTCGHIVNQSAKIPLALQYPPEAVAAGCAWMTMKILKLDTTPLKFAGKRQQPWYSDYGLADKDLKTIAEQVTEVLVGDAHVLKSLEANAVSVAVEVVAPPPPSSVPMSSGKRPDGPSDGGVGGGSQNTSKRDDSFEDLFKELDKK